MAKFVARDINELAKAISSPSGQNSVLNNSSIQSQLKAEANKLRNCIQLRLDDYYTSTESERSGLYNRTHGLLNSLEASQAIQVSVNPITWQIEIYFDEGAIGHSMFTGEKVNKAALINFGWRVRKPVWFKFIKNFGYFEGVHFIEDGIRDYVNKRPNGIKIIFDGKEY